MSYQNRIEKCVCDGEYLLPSGDVCSLHSDEAAVAEGISKTLAAWN